MTRFALLLPIALLAACDKGEDKSTVQIDTGSFKADVSLPGFARIGEGMDIDGAKLYPGTKVSNIAVDAKDERDGRVVISFTAPADRAKVVDWYAGQLKQNKFTYRPTPTGFAGDTADGDWFTLDLTAAGTATKGEFKTGKQTS